MLPNGHDSHTHSKAAAACVIQRPWPGHTPTYLRLREERVWCVISNLFQEAWMATYLKEDFKTLYFLLLKDKCFTEFCCFLSNLNMNQAQVYKHPLPFESPSQSQPSRLIQSPCLNFLQIPCGKFSLAISFTYGNVRFHVTPSIHLTISFLPHVDKSVLYVLFLQGCPANKFFKTIFLDSVYVCQTMIFIFLTHFTLIGSRSI